MGSTDLNENMTRSLIIYQCLPVSGEYDTLERPLKAICSAESCIFLNFWGYNVKIHIQGHASGKPIQEVTGKAGY